jgi:hypothetical protein
MSKSAEEIAAEAAASAAGAVDKTNTKPEEESLKKENDRLKGAIQGLQKIKDDFETYKRDQERAKLSDSDRVKAEMEDTRKARIEADTKVATLEKQLQTQRLVNELVADYGLSNPEFGEVIVQKFDPSKEAFTDFAKRVASDQKYAPVFARTSTGAEKSAPARGNAPPGPSTGSSRSRGNESDVQTAEDKAWAQRRYPGDDEKQKRLLEGLAAQRKSRG